MKATENFTLVRNASFYVRGTFAKTALPQWLIRRMQFPWIPSHREEEADSSSRLVRDDHIPPRVLPHIPRRVLSK